MNPRIASLQLYPFERLAKLIEGIVPTDKKSIALSVGEPKHPAPTRVLEALAQHAQEISIYPSTRGPAKLRQAISQWLIQRFHLNPDHMDPDRHVLPACGTREALYSAAQAIVDTSKSDPIVIMPNPFYQIYEGAALLAGAEPYFLNTTAETGYKMDFSKVPDAIWKRTQLVYLCSPGNPTGAVASEQDFINLLELAEKYNFVIASDECYSEIYFDENNPPLGLLQIAEKLGIKDYRRCLVFHSLSKRSNLPGLRSGFIAGDGAIMADYLEYRTYHGCTMSSLAQSISIQAWNDETHVQENRLQYRKKFDAVLEILKPVLPVTRPDAGFYLWARTSISDEVFTKLLFEKQNVKVLPGSYLSRKTASGNPGSHHVRMALVATVEECQDAAFRIKEFIEEISLSGELN
ncbi:MAG: succinyldiaminopimelate transaminase [Gammaproteobacteria bacterium]|nr:succinyldiaminopimelate transaminase [Gammaproteobacteria bacterium]